ARLRCTRFGHPPPPPTAPPFPQHLPRGLLIAVRDQATAAADPRAHAQALRDTRPTGAAILRGTSCAVHPARLRQALPTLLAFPGSSWGECQDRSDRLVSVAGRLHAAAYKGCASCARASYDRRG